MEAFTKAQLIDYCDERNREKLAETLSDGNYVIDLEASGTEVTLSYHKSDVPAYVHLRDKGLADLAPPRTMSTKEAIATIQAAFDNPGGYRKINKAQHALDILTSKLDDNDE